VREDKKTENWSKKTGKIKKEGNVKKALFTKKKKGQYIAKKG